MKRAAINYQTDFMPYSKAIRVFKNILNDVFKKEQGYEKIHFHSRKTDEINNEMMAYFSHHGHESNICFILSDLNEPAWPFCVSFTPNNSRDKTLSLELYYDARNKCCVHAFMHGPILSTNDGKYILSINNDISQSMPILIDSETDEILKRYVLNPNPNILGNIPSVFEKYNLKCTGVSIMKEED